MKEIGSGPAIIFLIQMILDIHNFSTTITQEMS